MKQISVNWVHGQKFDQMEAAKKALILAKEQESKKVKTVNKK